MPVPELLFVGWLLAGSTTLPLRRDSPECDGIPLPAWLYAVVPLLQHRSQ